MPQAIVELDLSGITPDLASIADKTGILRKEIILNLFDPPQREGIREEVVRLTEAGRNQRAIAKSLGVTQAAVSKALQLNQRMAELGLTSPYVVVTEAPRDYPKLRRSQNPRFCFDPLPGYPLP